MDLNLLLIEHEKEIVDIEMIKNNECVIISMSFKDYKDIFNNNITIDECEIISSTRDFILVYLSYDGEKYIVEIYNENKYDNTIKFDEIELLTLLYLLDDVNIEIEEIVEYE